MILVVSSTSDEHAKYVLAELERLGVDCRLLDLSAFPEQLKLSVRYDGGRAGNFQLSWPDGGTVDLTDVRAAWWRRPQPFGLSPAITRPVHRTFAYNECQAAFAGLWSAMDVFWVNEPTRDDVAARKAYQLQVARVVGLTIPETLITNDPIEARAFISEFGHQRTVYKAFTATQYEWRETRRVRVEELDSLNQVRHAPVIFQEYIEAGVDLRITVVGEDVFAAAIYSGESSYEVDYRVDMNAARTEPHDLPDQVRERLLALMRALGISYGAVDMRLTPDGCYVFLEVNPSGQWLFIEQRTGQPITAALARLLAEGGSNQ